MLLDGVVCRWSTSPGLAQSGSQQQNFLIFLPSHFFPAQEEIQEVCSRRELIHFHRANALALRSWVSNTLTEIMVSLIVPTPK